MQGIGGRALGRVSGARAAARTAFARARLPLAAAVAAALALGAPAAASATVTISPLPGTPTATPATQISVLGTPAANIESVTATGSLSGLHVGTLEAYSSAAGASFVPEMPFTEGEGVKVLVHLKEGGTLEDAFTVAHLAAGEELLHQVGEKPEDQEHYVTEPELHPPKLSIKVPDPSLEGDIFTDPLPSPIIHPGKKLLEFEPIGPNGLMILNPEGKILWWHQFKEEVGSVDEPIEYEGKPAMSWWQGKVTEAAYGLGEGVIANTHYEPIAFIKAGNGLHADIHEMYITPQGQAWIIAVEPLCLPECSSEHIPVLDDEIQEIDIKTGLVMWDWHAMGHVPDSQSEIEPANGVWDPYHTNSIQTLNGRVLLSMRDTSGVYYVEQSTGDIIWQISPKFSSLKLGKGTTFHFQHDARLEGKKLETLTLFDDEAGPPLLGPSKGLILKVTKKRVSLVHAYENPEGTVAVAEGSMQVLPHGEALVGYGAEPNFSEFSKRGGKHKNGKLLFEAELPRGDGTYRVRRFPWSGIPNTKPAVVAKRESPSEVDVYASWNGATEVAKWEVLAGEEADALTPIATTAWSNFETKIPVSSSDKLFEVKALNKEGKVLGASEAVSES